MGLKSRMLYHVGQPDPNKYFFYLWVNWGGSNSRYKLGLDLLHTALLLGHAVVMGDGRNRRDQIKPTHIPHDQDQKQ